MTNNERIQANNAELQECIALAENLPEAGSGGGTTGGQCTLRLKFVAGEDPVEQRPLTAPLPGYIHYFSNGNMEYIPSDYLIDMVQDGVLEINDVDVGSTVLLDIISEFNAYIASSTNASVIISDSDHDVYVFSCTTADEISELVFESEM
jgi:hypothetical protein